MAEPILSVARMRAREERTWALGVSPEAVIRRAGEAVAEGVRRRTRSGDPVLVLAGPGHNGDDAGVAAGALGDREVRFVRLPDVRAFELARGWLRQHRGDPRAWVIDGLFGIGLNRALEGDWAVLVDEVNAARVRVLAVDVPSGLDADTGKPFGPTVEATVTVTLGSPKRGLLREAVAGFVGRLELASEIGLAKEDAADEDSRWTEARDFDGYPPDRPVSGHKGAFGHLALLAGSVGYHGAAVLAAEGALRARPGLVTVFTDPRCYVPVAAQLRAAMVHPWSGEALEDGKYDAVVAGPGLASPDLPASAVHEVQRLWRDARVPMVVDASALAWLPKGGECAGLRVVTPHPGEAGRLLHMDAAQVQSDRWVAVSGLTDRWPAADVIVVLKGRHTLVGRRRSPTWVNSSGNPGLAQGGSGDVLAGLLGGLLAQRALSSDPGRAVRFGVWRHGAAADELEATGRSWTTEDLAEAL